MVLGKMATFWTAGITMTMATSCISRVSAWRPSAHARQPDSLLAVARAAAWLRLLVVAASLAQRQPGGVVACVPPP
jgi:hypothetical protein